MRVICAGTGKYAAILVFCLSPLFIHLGLRENWPVAIPALLAGAQIGVLSSVLLAGRRKKGREALAVVLGTAVAALIWHFGATGLAATVGLTHATAHTTLLTIFAASLKPGREPIVTMIARRVRVSMPDEVIRYTRRVTWAWCAFFSGHLLVSASLFLTAPRAWFFFVNLLNFPSILGMFCAEYAYRSVRFRHFPRSRLRDMIQAIRNFRAETRHSDPPRHAPGPDQKTDERFAPPQS